nr:ABC transporter permease [Agrobacterium vitis]
MDSRRTGQIEPGGQKGDIMFAYVARRLGTALIIVFCVATVVFSALHLVPGDPVELLLSGGGGVAPPPEAVAELREQLHLDRPVFEQYLGFLERSARFDLGRSFLDNSEVASQVASRLPRTLELVLVALVLALLIGLPSGTWAAYNHNGTIDRTGLAISSFFLSVPVFVIGVALIYAFSRKLGWFPSGGFVPITDNVLQHFQNLFLPALSIALGLSAIFFRMIRTTVLETMRRDWVRTAQAKGVRPSRIVRMHVVRNALGPVVTLVGLNAGHMLGGTVLVEYIFNYPGLSSLLVQAVEQRDYPIVQGVVLTISVCFVLINLAVDIIYGSLNPRIRG